MSSLGLCSPQLIIILRPYGISSLLLITEVGQVCYCTYGVEPITYDDDEPDEPLGTLRGEFDPVSHGLEAVSSARKKVDVDFPYVRARKGFLSFRVTKSHNLLSLLFRCLIILSYFNKS